MAETQFNKRVAARIYSKTEFHVYAVATIDQLGTYFKQEEEKYLIVSNDF